MGRAVKRSPLRSNPATTRAWQDRTRRALPSRSARYRDVPRSVRADVARRSGGYCEARMEGCEGLAVHMHHVLPRSQGGRHEAANLLHVCATDHDRIHREPVLSRALGLLRSRSA